MNVEVDDGGPAFPTHRNVNAPRADGFLAVDGMTLRAYFAAKAMAAMLSHRDAVINIQLKAMDGVEAGSVITARLAFEYADDMIAQMHQPPTLPASPN